MKKTVQTKDNTILHNIHPVVYMIELMWQILRIADILSMYNNEILIEYFYGIIITKKGNHWDFFHIVIYNLISPIKASQFGINEKKN